MSLVEAFVNVVSIIIALVTIITTPPPPSPFLRHHHHHRHQLHHRSHHQVSIDSPAPWSLPVTTHRKVVDWHGEDWATQVIFNYCCCCCLVVGVVVVVVVVGTARIGPLRFFPIFVFCNCNQLVFLSPGQLLDRHNSWTRHNLWGFR